MTSGWQLVIMDKKVLLISSSLFGVFNRHVPCGLGPKGEILLHPTQGTLRNSTGSKTLDPLGCSD